MVFIVFISSFKESSAMNNKINIHFLGDVVSGSKYLLDVLDKLIMIDCGQFRGHEDWAELDLLQPAVKIENLDLAVFPCVCSDPGDLESKLTEWGFKGRILSAKSTTPHLDAPVEASEKTVFWPDSSWNLGEILAETSQSPPRTFSAMSKTQEGSWMTLDHQIRMRFQCNPSLQEYVFIELDVQGERLFLTGEVGRQFDHSSADQERADGFDLLPPDFQPFRSPDSVPESSFWLG